MTLFEWIFGSSKTPQELLRQHQRSLEKAQRELDRERVKLENQEKKLIQEIKTTAKKGEQGTTRIKARDLVRTRKHIKTFSGMKAQLQAIALRIQTVRSNEQMMQSMNGATKLLSGMNRQLNLPALNRIALEFERENAVMDQRQEMMEDVIEDTLNDDEDEDESDEIVNQVLDELGLDLAQQLQAPPTFSGINVPNTTETLRKAAPISVGADPVSGGGSSGADDDLQARLDKMRKG